MYTKYFRYYFSDANSSSRSNCSRFGGGNSFRIGGNTAGRSPSSGVSNYGTIKVKVSCFTPRVSYNLTASGTIFVSI